MTSTPHTAATTVSAHLRAELAALGVAAQHCVDRADSYVTILREGQAVITVSGLPLAGDDVSVHHAPAEHAGWLACCRTPDDGYEIVHDTYDQETAYEADTAALLAAVLNTCGRRPPDAVSAGSPAGEPAARERAGGTPPRTGATASTGPTLPPTPARKEPKGKHDQSRARLTPAGGPKPPRPAPVPGPAPYPTSKESPCDPPRPPRAHP
ncbi:hypothetical protein ABZX75_26335 [Streptomyces sp. NPDC003038]|uniref:hypothetical protein n=1 Tax=unclassified Streptomyces TaxID=2593676 RepID=UPI0033BB516D